jgi:hypothetical protein
MIIIYSHQLIYFLAVANIKQLERKSKRNYKFVIFLTKREEIQTVFNLKETEIARRN